MVHKIFKNSTKDLKVGTSFNDTFRGYISDKVLQVTYPSTGESIEFNSGIIDDFSDNFSANWSREETYGRMDAIANYSNTTRNMSVRLILVAENSKIAVRNMSQMGKLAQFMYPTYDAGLIKDRPLLEVRLLNLIQDNGGPMIGYITNLNHGFDLKEGVFEVFGTGEEGPAQEGDEGLLFEGTHLYPKYLTISFDFNPLHSSRLGTDTSTDSKFSSFKSFPYGVADQSEPADPDEDLEENPTSTPEQIAASNGKTVLKPQDKQ